MAPAPLSSNSNGNSNWERQSKELLTRLKTLYTGVGVALPPITEAEATLLSIFFVILYIAPFYLSPTLRSTALANRNAPQVIMARIHAVFLVCLACTVLTVYVLAVPGHATPRECLAVLGIYPVSLVDIAKCLLLLVIWFIGPLFESGIVERGWTRWGRWSSIHETLWDDLAGYRNYVVGPASEELVFRALPIALFLLAQVPPGRIVFITPLIFGLAHLHHLHEHIVAHQSPSSSYLATVATPSVLLPGLVRCTVQFAYTSFFGFFEAFLFLRTGNLWSCILAHSFCNWCGLPRFWGRVGQEFGEEAAEAVPDKERDVKGGNRGNTSQGITNGNPATALQQTLSPGAPGQPLTIQWTVTYYVLLAAGALGFYVFLWPLTESDKALISFM